MSHHHCTFVPPHMLDHIARVHARESLEPSKAQRSAVVSAEFRRKRRYQAPGLLGAESAAAATAVEGAPQGLTVPQPGTAGRLIYDDLNQWNENVQLVRGEGDPAVAGQNANRAYDYLGEVRDYYKNTLGRTRLTTLASTSSATSTSASNSTTRSGTRRRS